MSELILVAVTCGAVGGWILNIVALVRAVRTPDHVFRLIGKTRSGQLTLHIAGIFLYLIGTIAGWVWLGTTKKQLDLIAGDGPMVTTTSFPPPQPPNPGS